MKEGAQLPMTRGIHLYPVATLLFVFSLVNLCLAIVALVQKPDEDTASAAGKRARWATIGIVLAGGSQLLYLIFSVLGLFRWIRFYPGNPIEIAGILAGLTLCAVGFVIALFGEGLRRWAGALYCVSTTILWLLAAIASVAV